jgi:hypothetical protein
MARPINGTVIVLAVLSLFWGRAESFVGSKVADSPIAYGAMFGQPYLGSSRREASADKEDRASGKAGATGTAAASAAIPPVGLFSADGVAQGGQGAAAVLGEVAAALLALLWQLYAHLERLALALWTSLGVIMTPPLVSEGGSTTLPVRHLAVALAFR